MASGGKYGRKTATYRAVSSAGWKSNDPRQQVARRQRLLPRVRTPPEDVSFQYSSPLGTRASYTCPLVFATLQSPIV